MHFYDSHPLPGIYSALESSAGVGTWRYTFKTQSYVWSPGLYTLLGLDHDIEPGFAAFTERVHPDDRLPTDNFETYLRQIRFIDRRLRILRPDGTVRWLCQKGEILYDSNREPAYAAGIVIDITDCVGAEGHRNAMEARLRTFTRTSHCFTWTVKPDGMKPTSQDWTLLTGQTQEESSGEGWLNAVYPGDRERVREVFRRAFATFTPYAATYRLLCRDGIMRWFLARCAPVFDSEGTLREWFGVGIDISDVNTVNIPFHDVTDESDPTGPLVKAARALLDWSIDDLAGKSGVSVSSIRRIESDQSAVVRNSTTERLLEALKSAGIEFYRADEFGTFVRLRK